MAMYQPVNYRPVNEPPSENANDDTNKRIFVWHFAPPKPDEK
jgi:hypothetical protein